MNRYLTEKKIPTIRCAFGKPEEIIPELIVRNRIHAVYCSHDYEPLAIRRDEKIKRLCDASGAAFYSVKDQVIFEQSEITKSDGTPYKVFTAYKNAWIAKLESMPSSDFEKHRLELGKFATLKSKTNSIEELEQMGFRKTDNFVIGGESAAKDRWRSFLKDRLDDYGKNRDLPGANRTSILSPYLRFGNLSVRQIVRDVKDRPSNSAQTFLSELIWREFFMMILFHFPHVVKSAFNSPYDAVPWQNRKDWFKRWQNGETGFPIVDAGMRQLNETGFMHNRVRMIVASFLVKHLHIDWRWGEKYFAEKLLDYELSSNNGNWQWAAGTGVDAAPYFRIFNPVTQGKKFDPEGVYIRRWIPELRDQEPNNLHDPYSRQQNSFSKYPPPLIDLKKEREICLQLYDLRPTGKE